MPSGNHDHEVDKDKSGGKKGSGGGGGNANSSGAKAQDKDGEAGKPSDKGRPRSKESLAAEGSEKVSKKQVEADPVGQALNSTDANPETRYGAGALATAGSQAQRDAIESQANDINEGDGVFGATGLFNLREKFDLSHVPGTGAPAPDASWGFDPFGAMADFAGIVTGIPFGAFYKTGKWATGIQPPEVNLGPNVFGADPSYGDDGWGGGGQSGPSNAGSDKEGKGGNGLLNNQATVNQQQQPLGGAVAQSPVPNVPGIPTNPAQINQSSKFPTPTQKFQGASYWAGDWVYDPAQQKAVWKQKTNGLLPEGIAA